MDRAPETGAALEAHDPAGRAIKGEALASEARQQALYELGLVAAPPSNQPMAGSASGAEGRAPEWRWRSYRKVLGLTQSEAAEQSGSQSARY